MGAVPARMSAAPLRLPAPALSCRPERPAVCRQLLPSAEMCGPDCDHAMAFLARLEALTAPQAPA